MYYVDHTYRKERTLADLRAKDINKKLKLKLETNTKYKKNRVWLKANKHTHTQQAIQYTLRTPHTITHTPHTITHTPHIQHTIHTKKKLPHL